MSEKKTALYQVQGSNIRHKGKIVLIGQRISLAVKEAERLAAFLVPLEQDVSDNDNLNKVLSDTEESLRQARSRIAELEDQIKTLVEEHENAIAKLNHQIAELKKPADKGGKK